LRWPRHIAFGLACVVLGTGCGDAAPPPPPGPICDGGTPVAPPPARAAVAGGLDAVARSLFVFGGDIGQPQACVPSPQPAQDTWRYDLTCKRWMPISPSISPPPRTGAAYATEILPSRRRLIVFGGRTGGPGAWTLLNDMWAFDLMQLEWKQLTPAGTPPPARADGAAAFHAGRDLLVVFGGNATADPAAPAQPMRDLWLYDLDQNKWTQQGPPMMGQGPPEPRLLHAMTYASSLQLVFVGLGVGAGAPAPPYFNDLYTFDLEMNRWTKTTPTNRLPSGRISAGVDFSIGTGQLILFGGRDEGPLGFQNDAWGYSQTLGWQRLSDGDAPNDVSGQMCARPADFITVPMSSFPPPERREAPLFAWDQAVTGVGYLYGGRGDCGNLDDVNFILLTVGWQPLTPPTTGASCAHSGRTGCQGLCQ